MLFRYTGLRLALLPCFLVCIWYATSVFKYSFESGFQNFWCSKIAFRADWLLLLFLVTANLFVDLGCKNNTCHITLSWQKYASNTYLKVASKHLKEACLTYCMKKIWAVSVRDMSPFIYAFMHCKQSCQEQWLISFLMLSVWVIRDLLEFLLVYVPSPWDLPLRIPQLLCRSWEAVCSPEGLFLCSTYLEVCLYQAKGVLLKECLSNKN